MLVNQESLEFLKATVEVYLPGDVAFLSQTEGEQNCFSCVVKVLETVAELDQYQSV